MALRNQPYLPLYVQDYLTDEKLNMCSASTQGVYIKVMCIFHKSDQYGGILLKQKDKQNDKQILNFAYRLARLLPFTQDEVVDAVTELVDEGVLTIDDDFLFQKRMVKDGAISDKRANAGKSGGEKTSLKFKDQKDFAIAKEVANSEANLQQNTEYEIEYEDVIEITTDNRREPRKKNELELSEESSSFVDWWIKDFLPDHIKATDKMKTDWRKVWDRLRKDHPKEVLQEVIKFTMSDKFEAKNMQTPMKLTRTNPDGVKYIDKFITQWQLKHRVATKVDDTDWDAKAEEIRKR